MILEKTRYVWVTRCVNTRLAFPISSEERLSVVDETCMSGKRGVVFRLYNSHDELVAIDRYYAPEHAHISQIVEYVCEYEYGIHIEMYYIKSRNYWKINVKNE